MGVTWRVTVPVKKDVDKMWKGGLASDWRVDTVRAGSKRGLGRVLVKSTNGFDKG